MQTITESVYASGKVKSKNQYEAFSPVPGIIRQVHVTEGTMVHKGDPLVSLVNETSQLSREAAGISAQYSTVQANLDKLQEAEANIDLAKTKLQNDSLLLDRQAKLWNSGIGTRNDLEQRQLAVKNSATAYQTARLRYRQLKQQLTLNEKQSRKNLQISSTVAGDYIVRAKQDGTVYSFDKEVGEVVSPQVPIAVIGNSEDFILELQVDEYDIAKIKPGQKVLVSMDSYKGQAFDGIVTKIEPIMNERSRSVTIEAAFTKSPPSLYPNLTAEANILINSRENAITIPRDYLIDDSYVLLKGGEKRKVAVGLKDYQKAEVLQGIGKDDIIQKPEQ
ncbi:efflux RND transporter periplasmic adaptor subunit [Flavisolibacter nicotianae]|uniref:efflux RND transporter periplasmic adaptor subunit n=1 Tax=Flavisolibacter nicotianae TaxID=2364882 RepID=UPI001F08BC8C|nr:HlyD family efflux transporter periplasmic adaptor subunit [Flavisolibacter nicotianae]